MRFTTPLLVVVSVSLGLVWWSLTREDGPARGAGPDPGARPSVTADESPRLEGSDRQGVPAEADPATAGPLENPGRSEAVQRILRVKAGITSREEFGPGYEEILWQCAEESLASLSDGLKEGWCARLCGFRNWSAVEAALEDNSPEAVAVRPMLADLVEDARAAMPYVEEAVLSEFELRDRITVWAHESEELPPSRPGYRDSDKGAIRFARSCAYGDRAFRLEFDSAEHPALNERLKLVEAKAREFHALDR